MKFSIAFGWLLFLVNTFCLAQERIDGTLPFQTDPAKKYSIYIPSEYDSNTSNKLMVGFHPFNVNRWDAISWCDTLIQFAEDNNLIMICPDGGTDGKVDDPIDLEFTTLLMDSMMTWYNIDQAKIWAMGFSWGGRTTYSYGLSNADKFAGFLPIGAAITGTDQVTGIIDNAADKPFYVIHGSNDSPSVRYTPVVEALGAAGACVETNLLSGVGHTIDFPNRNAILTEAFQWLETIACNEVSAVNEMNENDIPLVFPNPIFSGATIELIDWKNAILFDIEGKQIQQIQGGSLNTSGLNSGIYFIKGTYKGRSAYSKIVVH